MAGNEATEQSKTVQGKEDDDDAGDGDHAAENDSRSSGPGNEVTDNTKNSRAEDDDDNTKRAGNDGMDDDKAEGVTSHRHKDVFLKKDPPSGSQPNAGTAAGTTTTSRSTTSQHHAPPPSQDSKAITKIAEDVNMKEEIDPGDERDSKDISVSRGPLVAVGNKDASKGRSIETTTTPTLASSSIPASISSNPPPSSVIESQQMPSQNKTSQVSVENDKLSRDNQREIKQGTVPIPKQPPPSSSSNSESTSAKTSLPRPPPPAPTSSSTYPGKTTATKATTSYRVDARARLEKMYAPFIVESDTSLEAARRRLETAIDQTRQLRAAFTERVYGKYRVCLKPPPPTSQIVKDIKADPQKALRKLNAETKMVATEKELEKKEAAIINNELSDFLKAKGEDTKNPLSALNADNAEQLMYVTTGLNLVILPESDASPEDLKFFEDRGPFDPVTGNRLRCINQSSAAASGVVLDRCRQAVRLKSERDRRRQSQIKSEGQNRSSSSSIASASSTAQNYSRLSIISTKPKIAISKSRMDASKTSSGAGVDGAPQILSSGKVSTIPLDKTTQQDSTKKRPRTLKEQQAFNLASARAIRARVQAGMTPNTLLSINPSHEELRTDGKVSASTIAMMENGVGGYFGVVSKKSQQRHRHPFPDSIGGRRRNQGSMRSDGVDPLELPPMPTIKERRRAPKMTAVPSNEDTTANAAGTVQQILDQFGQEIQPFQRPRKRRATDISLMRTLTHFNCDQDVNDSSPEGGAVSRKLALNVMKAVGLIKPSTRDNGVATKPFQASFRRSILDPQKMKDRGVVVDSGPFGRLIANFETLENQYFSEEKVGVASIVGDFNSGKHRETKNPIRDPYSGPTPTPPVKQIRGGGGEDENSISPAVENSGPKAGSVNQDKGTSIKDPGISSSNPLASGSQPVSTQQPFMWDGRSQQILQAQIAQAHAAQMQGQLRSADNYNQLNTFQLAQQLRMSSMAQQQSHPQSGDFSDYMNRLNHSQQAQATQAAYNWNAASSAAAALAMNQHHQSTMTPFAVQGQARAFFNQGQQSFAAQAALQQQQQAAALMGNTGSSNSMIAPGYAAFGGNLTKATNGITDQSGFQQMTSTKTAPPSKVINKPSASDRLLNKLEPDLEPTPLPDVEPEPIDETLVKKVQSNVSIKGEASKSNGDAGRNVIREGTSSMKRKAPEAAFDSVSVTDQKKKSRHSNDKAVLANKQEKNSENEPKSKVEEKKSIPGLQCFLPPTPDSIGTEKARLILSARCHEAIGPLGEFESTAHGEKLVSYLKSLGAAVPIPEEMISSHLKERLTAPAFKNSGVGSIPALSQGIIMAVILHWLWHTQEGSFQRAFSKMGRVDEDPECKWLVQAALDKAVDALSKEVADAATRATSPLAVALLAHKNKNNGNQKGPALNPAESLKATTTRLDLLAASIVSRALNVGFVMNEEVNSILPHFQDLLGYLDDCRKSALYCRSQERVLLATLVARKSTMSFNFSHAYVSAMVRAGEALGHGEVFAAVQNEKVGASSMIPYDVFTDESGAWEEPCRPEHGYKEELTGEELMRRAHARAMIQKSLRKLQDRHGIKGGTPIGGPYTDQTAPATSSSGRRTPSATTPRGRRRSSFSERTIQPGTGSAPATSWDLYDPKHVSEPLLRDSSTLENSPYGIYDTSSRPRSFSLSQGAALMRHRGRGSILGSGKDLRRQSSGRSSSHSLSGQPSEGESESVIDDGDSQGGNADVTSGGLLRSTREIPWKDVAGIFQQMQLPASTKDKSKDKPSTENVASDNKDRTIYAPFVRKVDDIPVYDSDESDTEEDLSDEAVLTRHRVVLDRMKERLAVVLETRKRAAQDRRKSRGR